MTRPTIPIDATFEDVMLLAAEQLKLMCVNLPVRDIEQHEWEEWLTTLHGDDVTRLYALVDSCENLNKAMMLLGEWERGNPPDPAASAEPPAACQACGEALLPENKRIADGCPCNSPRGINHGLVAKNTCTCIDCDPEQTGGTR